MLKGSQSRVDFRRKDLYKKLGIFAAIALPVVAVGAFLAVQTFAGAGPGGGATSGGGGGCQPDDGSAPNYYDTCTGAAWIWYETSSNSVNLGGGGSTAATTVTGCAAHGGYWLYNFVMSGTNPPATWTHASGSIPIGWWSSGNTWASVKLGGNMGWFGPSDDAASWATAGGAQLTNGAWGAWPEVQAFWQNGRNIYDQAVAGGMNYQQAEAIGIPPYQVTGPYSYNTSVSFDWAVGSDLSWFCAGRSLGTTITPDSFVNGQHRGQSNPVVVERGDTVSYTHQLTRDNTNDPGTGQYWIVESKYPDQNGNNPASSSMGSQGTATPLTDASFSGTNSNITPGYATINFTIPSNAVNGSIWCQHIEFWAPNDLGGHNSYAERGFPTWDGSSTTRGEVCAKVVVPKHTPDSFINGLHQGMTNPVEAERGVTVNFTHTLVRDQVLNPGTGQYRIVETKYPAKDGNLPASSSMTTQNTPQVLNSATFGGTLTATLASNYATIPFTIPSNAVNGSIWCQHIEFWAPNDNNTPPNDSTANWGYPAWDGSSTTKGEVCVTAIVPVHTPDSFVDKTPDGQPDGERGPVYIRPGDDFEFEHRIDKDRPNLNGGLGIYEINEEVTNGGLAQCIWDPLNNGSIMSNANFASSPNPFTPTHPDNNSSTYGNSRIDSDHTLVPCTSDPMDPENATYCQNINFWTSIDGNVPTAFDSNHSWGRSEYVCAIVRIPDLKIVKTTPKTDLEVDEEFEYEITVTNTDEFIDTAGLIRVTDSLPEGIAFSSLTETCETIDPEEEGEEPEEVCEALPPVVSSDEMDCEVVGNSSFKCDTTNVLDPQEANSFTIKVRVKAVGMIGKTEFDNRAFVGGGGDRNCPVDNNNIECSDNIIVRIPSLPEPPKTGVVLGSSTPDSATRSNLSVIIGSAVVALFGIAFLGFQAAKRNR